MPFQFSPLRLDGVVLVKPGVFGDQRGHFLETFSRSAFEKAGLPREFVQENHSRSVKGVLRGLHFQLPPCEQGKLVRVIAGEIYDVVVDLRPNSQTFGEWVGATLSSENFHQLYVPPGFAHGFCVMSDLAEVSYLVTQEYSPAHEYGLLWNDPSLKIAWPEQNPLVAPRDQKWPTLRAAMDQLNLLGS